jgi:hypothetical protein
MSRLEQYWVNPIHAFVDELAAASEAPLQGWFSVVAAKLQVLRFQEVLVIVNYMTKSS